MNKLKRIIIGLIISLGFVAPTLVPVVAGAVKHPDIEQNLCSGSELTVSGDCTDIEGKATGKTVDKLIADVINIFSLVVGVVSVIMIIFGGFKYITSGGESGNVTGAKNTIMYALIGLVIVALSQLIVKFVLNRVITATDP